MSRAEVLAVLRAAPAGLSAAAVAAEAGIHVNTSRFHLDALVREGSPGARGRPRTVYRPVPGMDRGGVRSYQLLAQILLSRLSAGPDAGQSAVAAGRAWGSFLAGRPEPYSGTSSAAALTRLTALLDSLGFAPQTKGETIRLRHCPFLELAEGYDHLVCRIHLGLMQGALAGLRAPVTAARLEPFAEPGACLALLEPASPGGKAP
jgi:predicted ArsR family transcriptional regulator